LSSGCSAGIDGNISRYDLMVDAIQDGKLVSENGEIFDNADGLPEGSAPSMTIDDVQAQIAPLKRRRDDLASEMKATKEKVAALSAMLPELERAAAEPVGAFAEEDPKQRKIAEGIISDGTTMSGGATPVDILP